MREENFSITTTMEHSLWAGLFWKLLSCACFAAINCIVRFLSGGAIPEIANPLPVYTIMFFQNIVGIACFIPWLVINHQQWLCMFTTKHPGLHAIRIISAVAGIGCWYLSLQFLPVTQVVALSFTAPMITVLGAKIFLKESLSWQRLTAIAFSMLGSFLIIRPDQNLHLNDLQNWLLCLPLLAALIFALDKLISRKLLHLGESPSILAVYLLAFMGPLSFIPARMYGWVTPVAYQIPWLILLGMLAAAAHYTFGKAYKFAEVTLLMPFGLSKIIFCACFSYLAFTESPKTLDVWLGVSIVTFSTILLGFHKNSTRLSNSS